MPRWQRILFGLILTAGLALVSALVGSFIGSKIYDGPPGFDALGYMLGAFMLGALVGTAIGVFAAIRAAPKVLRRLSVVFGVLGLVLVLFAVSARYRQMQEAATEELRPKTDTALPAEPVEPAPPAIPPDSLR